MAVAPGELVKFEIKAMFQVPGETKTAADHAAGGELKPRS
jgi:hypothetical protein